MGESVTEGSIVEWRVRPGDWIEEGATLVDVTTDKVDVEVPAPVAGIVARLLAAEGATVAVGTTIAEIDPAATKPAGAPASAAAPAIAPAAAKPAPAPVKAAAPPAPSKQPGAASHRARRLAERERLDLGRIPGTGPDGL